ncbi:MAG: tetratricopeptide repeat protein [Gemmatimonadales bacterium]
MSGRPSAADLFDQAIDLPPAERPAFLERACGGDALLRDRVIAMLAADSRESALLDGGTPERLAAAVTPGPLELIGRVLGPYRIVEVVGRGGMGVVCLAEREDVGKRVALKLVAGGLASPERVARFFRERRVLAQLEHPDIARLLDAGVADDGTPWLAMEFVAGLALDQYCAEGRLGLDERLALFERICGAVAFAHRHLVIHRDLKPSNILVTAEGDPRLLDFGIAKLLSDTDDPLRTETGRGLLTPQYAAPEQLTGQAVTTATDIYQLGGLLFQLLTDASPHAPDRRSDTPVPRPSTRLTGTLARSVAGDLDTIVAKATETDPGRRYRSVDELAADVGRHRQGLPIQARPATLGYRLGKLIRRQRLAASALVVAAVVLGGFGIAMVRSSRRIAAERARTEQVAAMLAEMFAGADPWVVPGDTLTVVAQLDRGARRVLANPTLDPVVRARLLTVIAIAYDNLGRPGDALPLRERVLELWREARPPTDRDRLLATRKLAQLLAELDSTDRAVTVADEAIAAARMLSRDRRPELAAILNDAGFVRQRAGRYTEARPFYEEAIAVGRELSDSLSGRSETLVNLAQLASNRGEPAVAESLLRQAYGLRRRLRGPDDPATARAALQLANLLTRQGNVAEAEPLIDSAIATQERTFPGPSKEKVIGLNARASLLAAGGRFADAAVTQRDLIEMTRQVFGERSTNLAPAIANLAGYVQRGGDLDAAAALHREALDRYEAAVGRWHSGTAIVGTNLAFTEALRHRLSVAESLYRIYLPVLDSVVPESRARISGALDFVWVLRLDGRCREAETTARTVVERLANRPSADVESIRARRLLGECLLDLGQYQAAESLLVDAPRSLRVGFGAKNPFTAAAAADLDTLYRRWKRRPAP